MKTSTVRFLVALLCAQMIFAGSLVVAAEKKAPTAAELKKREEELRKREAEIRKKQEADQRKEAEARQKAAEKKFAEQRKKFVEQQKKALVAQKKAYDAEQKRLAEAMQKKQEEDAKRAAAEKKKKQEAAKAPPKSTPAATAKTPPAAPPKAAPAKVPTPVVSRPVVSPSAAVPASTEPKWSTLFDGKSTAFFRGSAGDAFPKESWAVEGGALKSLPDAAPADLLSRLEYENFEMEFEWKVKPGAKSALVYRTKEADGASHVGPAMALVSEGKDPKLAPGALAGLLPSSAVEMKPAGEFNQGKLVVLGDRVEHWINGQKVLEYDWSSPDLKKVIADSKLADNTEFMARKNGYLAFQHGGDEAWFRNIRLRRLSLK